ncbi:MAG TPA: Os1348 family NHLP clan protein [Vicinamibacterales bacterium]|nr:Os1348 family NHLP clan protein [Vicinamibacterales bacterium]
MAQRIVETLIGRLMTDEQFRAAFLANPAGTLLDLRSRGLELTETEAAALIDTDPALWTRAAEGIHPRLRKASLVNDPSSESEKEHHV